MPKGEPIDISAEARFPWRKPDSKAFRWGQLLILISDNDDFGDGELWVHCSVSCRNRIPFWDELKAVRAQFFPAWAEVIQVFPPEDEYVNTHPNCLHLWWNKSRRLTPKMFQWAVGIPGMELK